MDQNPPRLDRVHNSSARNSPACRSCPVGSGGKDERGIEFGKGGAWELFKGVPERGPAGAASLFCELQNSTHYWIAGRRVQGGAEDVQELRMQRLAWLRQRILLDEDHFYCARTSACKGKEDPIFRECRDLQCDRVHSEAEGDTQQRIRIVSKHSSSRQCLRCTQNMRMNEFSEAATLPATDLAKIWKIKRGTVAKRSRRFQFFCSMHFSSYVTISGLRFGLPPIVKFSNRNMINNTC